jgi:hypothetical protein
LAFAGLNRKFNELSLRAGCSINYQPPHRPDRQLTIIHSEIRKSRKMHLNFVFPRR